MNTFRKKASAPDHPAGGILNVISAPISKVFLFASDLQFLKIFSINSRAVRL